jgi:predicted NUDIX family NTP pyrophosphohydrolase
VAKQSAGLLMFRRRAGGLEVLLVHPGGPFFASRDAGAWSIPKGEFDSAEAPLAAACREFTEETGLSACGPFLPLGEVRQRGGKRVSAWAFEGDGDPAAIRSNTIMMEWPPRSGRMREFPEVDRAAFFPLNEARQKINAAQVALLDALSSALSARPG